MSDVGCCVNWASSSITLVVDEAILIFHEADFHNDDVDVNALSLSYHWLDWGWTFRGETKRNRCLISTLLMISIYLVAWSSSYNVLVNFGLTTLFFGFLISKITDKWMKLPFTDWRTHWHTLSNQASSGQSCLSRSRIWIFRLSSVRAT